MTSGEDREDDVPVLGDAPEPCGNRECSVCWLLQRPGESFVALVARLTLRLRGALPSKQGHREVAPNAPATVQCPRCNAWRAPNTHCANCQTRTLRRHRQAQFVADREAGRA